MEYNIIRDPDEVACKESNRRDSAQDTVMWRTLVCARRSFNFGGPIHLIIYYRIHYYIKINLIFTFRFLMFYIIKSFYASIDLLFVSFETCMRRYVAIFRILVSGVLCERVFRFVWMFIKCCLNIFVVFRVCSLTNLLLALRFIISFISVSIFPNFHDMMPLYGVCFNYECSQSC